MNIRDLRQTANLTPLKLAAREVLHIVIEPDLTCNLRCKRCYNLYGETVKTLNDECVIFS